jgi:hypothetical protein
MKKTKRSGLVIIHLKGLGIGNWDSVNINNFVSNQK